jgi:adenylate cyclase
MALAQSNGFSLKTSLLFPAIALVTATTALSVACLGFFFFQWQEATLESQRIEAAKQTLGLFARQAAFPLAADDHLVLESLFRTGPLEKPLLYLAIANAQQTVQYHSNPDRVGTIMVFPVGPDHPSRQGPFQLQPYRLETGVHVLDLSIPVSYRHAILGYAHLGLSLDDLRNAIDTYQKILFRRFLFWGVGLLAVSVISGILFALTLGRIIHRKRDRQGAPLPEMAGARFSSVVPAGHRENETQDLSKAPFHSSRALGNKMADLCLPKGSSPDKFARNHVTVLSAGVRGFRSLADDKNASEALRSLNAYFAIADDIIQEHGGVIDKFIGDAVIGVFVGSPLSPDHSERAVRCALALQKGLHRAGEDGNPIMRKIGIGISSGVVISAYMGPRSREECAFLGESFKLAYSLNVMAGPG